MLVRSCVVAVGHADKLGGVAAGVVRVAGAADCPWVVVIDEDDDGS